MRLRMVMLAVLGAALVAAAGISTPGVAAGADVPGAGMCNGRADASLEVIAHANGIRAMKFILNVSTDANAVATGALIFDRGPDHIVVTDFCRVWQHTPDTAPKCEEPYPEGATTAHVVGFAALRDGTRLLVRADVRATDEGKFFRVRYRPLTEAEHVAAATDEGGCEDGSWTWYPAEEGWAPLKQLMVRPAAR